MTKPQLKLINKIKNYHTSLDIDFSTYIHSKKDYVSVFCKKCNYNWITSINSLYCKRGCPECARKQRYLTRISNNKNRFIVRANKVHNNKFTYNMSTYVNNNTKMKIICPIHGIFLQTPKDHLSGRGCKECKQGWGFKRSFFKDKPTKLYYIQFENGVYKIGITNQRYLSQRFNNDINYKILRMLEFKDGAIAWDIEKEILKRTKKDKYTGDLFINKKGLKNGETECRIKDISSTINNIILKDKYVNFYTEYIKYYQHN